MQDISRLRGDLNVALDVSADGSIVVGWMVVASEVRRAFRWTESGGMEDLNQTYAVLLTRESVLVEANAISPDGRYIVGTGWNAAIGRYEGFLLDTWRTGDTNGNGCIDDSDLLAVLFAFGTPGTGYTRHEDISSLPLGFGGRGASAASYSIGSMRLGSSEAGLFTRRLTG